jgi:hypothetical protein
LLQLFKIYGLGQVVGCAFLDGFHCRFRAVLPGE